jgi:hypothetical protein
MLVFIAAAKTAQATQELSLKVSDSSVSLVQLQFVKYQNVNKIVVSF